MHKRHKWRLDRSSLDAPGERVAGLEAAGVEAGLEPVRPLFRCAVGKGLGVDPPLGLSLDAVVTDGRGRGQALLKVAALQNAAVVRRTRPDTRQAIGLELQPH